MCQNAAATKTNGGGSACFLRRFTACTSLGLFMGPGLLPQWRGEGSCRSNRGASSRDEGDYARLVHIEIPVTGRVARARIGVDAPIRKVANAPRRYNPASRWRCVDEHTETTDRELVAALSATSQNRIQKTGLGAVVEWWGAYRSAKLSQVGSIAHAVHGAIRRLGGENAAQRSHCGSLVGGHLRTQQVRDGNGGDDQNDRHNDQKLD